MTSTAGTGTCPNVVDPGMRLLLVEDDPSQAALIQRVLSQVSPDVRVEHCTTGEQALERLASAARSLDLVLLDLDLPGIDGFAVLEGMAPLDGPVPPVVVLSANHRPEAVARAYRAGASAFLRKPGRINDLKTMLTSVVSFWLGWNVPSPLAADRVPKLA